MSAAVFCIFSEVIRSAKIERSGFLHLFRQKIYGRIFKFQY
ncbi:Uncharacterized protein dnm_023370 [Desulfonema magnum]|uniref:Uncharacterized protein n=1 Tax=Desulfonema magnum TaxID=45655 RepID=A0A975BJ57_9BACT|nr:Uncharacterized protein dnm_023370 [Desulfonema magnum]